MENKSHIWFWLRYYYRKFKPLLWFIVGFAFALALAYNTTITSVKKEVKTYKCVEMVVFDKEQVICKPQY